MNCSDSQISRNNHFFNQHDSSFGRHVNAKAKKFKRGLSQNQEPIRSENLYGYYFSAALIHQESKIPGGSVTDLHDAVT